MIKNIFSNVFQGDIKMAETKFSYSVINITTHPHSCDAFQRETPITEKYFGNDYVSLKINNICIENDREFVTGYIYKYTQIRDGEWFDSDEGTVLSGDDRPSIDISRFYPNATTLNFVFIPEGHRLFFTTKHQGTTLSQAYFARALSRILNNDEFQEKYGEVTVTVEIDDKGMEAINKIQILEKLFIRVSIPNGDDLSSEKAEFIARMEGQNASSIDETLKAKRHKHITPDAKTKALMELAQSNGFIIARGIDHGERVTRKSSEYPVEYTDFYNQDGDTILNRLIINACNKIQNFIQRQNS